ncbi:hypothetical protein P7B02_17540 [Caulobacter segnis]|uniref:hypothetical protein n=1 Tax=Caulobacter segnis TaxID=88688 RepID=UPI00240FA664|nr:hypothetical protein [Caulobacter segnis]MDG2523336.1 hypothetical protein [Caulobacter segnis]
MISNDPSTRPWERKPKSVWSYGRQPVPWPVMAVPMGTSLLTALFGKGVGITWLLTSGLVVGGYYFWKNWRAGNFR